MKFAPLVVKNLLRNKRRTILTFLSVAVSIFVFTALISLPVVTEQLLKPTAASLRIVSRRKASDAFALPQAYEAKIARLPHIESVLAVSSFGGIYHDVNDQFSNLAVDDNLAAVYLAAVYPDWNIAPAATDAFRRIRRACLVGKLTMRHFNLHVGQFITLRGTWYPFDVNLQLVGVLDGTAPGDILVFRRDYLTEASNGSFPISMYWSRVDDPGAVPLAISEIDRAFANSDHETRTESEQAYARGFLRNFGLIFTLVEALGLAVVVSIALAAANSAAMSARERRREMAIMRTLGFSRGAILTLFVAETLVVALAAGGVGCLGAFVALKVLALRMSSVGVPPSLVGITAVVAIEGIAAALTIGFAGAAIPYGIAVRRNVTESLRAVG
jgi:putative ABC transport system permease protein